MDNELRAKIEACARTAEEFTKLYFDSLDKRRHQINGLYLDNATLVWNGNGVQGKENIQTFLNDLPSTVHTVNTLNAQPVEDEAVGGQPTCVIMAGGMAKYAGQPIKPFQQNAMITVFEGRWKIVSDCYRTQDSMVSPWL